MLALPETCSGLEHRCPAQLGQTDRVGVSQPSPHAATAATQPFISLPLKRGDCLVTGEISAHKGHEKKINQAFLGDGAAGCPSPPLLPFSPFCMRFGLLMSRSDLWFLPNLPPQSAAPGELDCSQQHGRQCLYHPTTLSR